MRPGQLLIFVGLSLAFGCKGPSEEKVLIVPTRDIPTLLNATRSGFWSESVADSASAIALEIGDLIATELVRDEKYSDMAIFEYTGRDTGELTVKPDPGNPCKILINKSEFGATLEDSAAWKWIEGISKEELKNMQSVLLQFPVTEQQMAVLSGLARQKPELNLIIFNDSTINQLDSIISMFSPKWLYLSSPESVTEAQLSGMKGIRQLIIEKYTGDLKSFKDLDRLTHLNIKDSRIGSINELALPEKIRSLYLTDCPVTDITGISAYKDIEALGFVVCDTLSDISPVLGMKKLRWLACPPNITQAQFDSVIPSLPSLEVLELIKCDSLRNLNVLTKLPGLKSLALDCDNIDPDSIPATGNLKLLVLRSSNDSITYSNVAMLQQKFPQTTVVPGGGFCLGSGWLLILFPVITLLFLFRRMKPAGNA